MSEPGFGERELRGQRVQRGLVWIEALHFLERCPNVFQHAGVERHGCAEKAALDAPTPHPDLKALPLLGRRMGLQHVRG